MSQQFDQLQRFIANGRAAQAAVDVAIVAAPYRTQFRVKVQYPNNVQAYACAILLPDGRLPRVGDRTGGRGRISDVYQVPDNSVLPVTAYSAPPKVL
jgi:hypothetical protein